MESAARQTRDGPAQTVEREPDSSTRLAAVASTLERTGWTTALYDAQWRLVWTSEELRTVCGCADARELGQGLHVLETWRMPAWERLVPEHSVRELVTALGPILIADTPGGKDELLEVAGPTWGPLLRPLEAIEPPPLNTGVTRYAPEAGEEYRVTWLQARIRDERGHVLGTAVVFGPALPTSLLALLVRGDEAMFTRMAELAEPCHREAAILFADLQTSGALSRHLSSGAYFTVIRELTTAIDRLVIAKLGIVGRHAGDGVTAFFLADQVGSPSAAALAAVQTARGIGEAAARAGAKLGETLNGIEASDCLINVGVHWGGSLYMGQIVTGGRLEVTALGDEVNECARIQESARDGQALASKSLIERLSRPDAETLGFDPDLLVYRTVGEIAGASEKAVRDAGSVAVTAI